MQSALNLYLGTKTFDTSSILDKICGIIGGAAHADVVVLARRDTESTIAVVGACGTSIRHVDIGFVLPRLQFGARPFIYVPKLSIDPDFREHPLTTLFPGARSLCAMIVAGTSDSDRLVLKIVNPSPRSIKDGKSLAAIHALAEVAGRVWALENECLRKVDHLSHGLSDDVINLVDSNKLPAALLDADHRIMRANSRFCALLSTSCGKAKAKDIRKFLSLNDDHCASTEWGSLSLDTELELKTGQHVRCAFLPLTTPDGTWTIVLADGRPEIVKKLLPASETTAVGYRADLQSLNDREDEAKKPDSFEPTAQFLIKTLVTHHSLLKRNNCRYLALRSWRSAIKEHQIAALKALKTRLSKQFVSAVAGEFVAATTEIFGTEHIKAVIPIPCGNSGLADCLSVQLARAIAAEVSVPMVEALEGQGGMGGSTPRKSARLSPYRVKEQVSGPVLLVDDVASSGRHMELATLALRDSGCSVHGMVWIGGGGRKPA